MIAPGAEGPPESPYGPGAFAFTIVGMLVVQGSGVLNSLQFAMTEFLYHLVMSDLRSYYNPQDIEILDECWTVANVGWLHRLM
ncbi:MAG: hypothetical protein ACKOF7_01640, partial [Phycisphaerales bacterium]